MQTNDFRDFFKNKRVLVTGHTGFKGSWLTKVLLNCGAEVIGISLPPESKPNLFDLLHLKDKIENYFVDIEDYSVVQKIFDNEQPEVVFHLAAQAIVRTSYEKPLRTFSSNVMGTAHILEAIKNTPSVKSAVIITTDKVYENKEWHHAYRENDALGGYDPYSSSKAAADIVTNAYIQSFFNTEKYLDGNQALIAIARAGNVIGGGDWSDYRLIPDIVRSIYEKKEKIFTRNPNAIRPWQHVLEPLTGYMMLAKSLYEGNKHISGAWNFGPNNESFVSVENLIKNAIRILGTGEYEVYSEAVKMHEANLLRLDINKAHAVLSWRPKLNLEQNLNMTFDWYRHYYEKSANIEEFTDVQIEDYLHKRHFSI